MVVELVVLGVLSATKLVMIVIMGVASQKKDKLQ